MLTTKGPGSVQLMGRNMEGVDRAEDGLSIHVALKKQKLTGSVRVNKIPNVCNLRNIHPNKKNIQDKPCSVSREVSQRPSSMTLQNQFLFYRKPRGSSLVRANVILAL